MLIDILLIVFGIVGFWLGFSRGMLSTLLHVAIYFVALILTLVIAPPFAEFVSNTLPIGILFALIFSSIGIFILLCYVLGFLTKRFDRRTKIGKKGSGGKISGGILMMLFGILIYGLLIGAINQFDLLKAQTKHSSKTYPYLKKIPMHAAALVETFKPVFRNYRNLMKESIQQSNNDS